MNERPRDSQKPVETPEAAIERLTDVLGISYSEAERRLGLGGDQATGFTAQESRQLHPSSHVAHKRRRPLRPAVGEDSQDEFTGIISREQARINTQGAELARQALRAAQEPLDALERARQRAREERRHRRA